ncbi:MAG: TonB-dependent receptor [Gemmatimonadaceae bacterium]|nr:TonB-dependent receptor [Chitinophagaceae bacterium]
MQSLLRRCLPICMLGLVVLFSQRVSSQQKNVINGKFLSAPFETFIKTVESQTNFRFFYKSSEADSIKVTLDADEMPVRTALDKVFANTSFRFSFDESNRVFITRLYQIHTALPEGYFEQRAVNVQQNNPAVAMPLEKSRKKEVLTASLENKLYEVGSPDSKSKQAKPVLSGYVRDAKNGEALSNATVYVDTPAVAVLTDQFGHFSLTLPKGRHTINISSIGMKNTVRQVLLQSDGALNIELVDNIVSLKAVTVTGEKKSNVRGLQMGVEKINIKTIKQLPVVFGEADVLRAVLTLPGVVSVGESSTGFNVRGGSADQNLILFNDATIYNPAHLFGFFSAFNPDVIKGVELYKSAIPERYGGRLSSVLDVTSRSGNSKKLSGMGGIGPLTSKLTIEGPIVKDKTSFIAGGRTTYSNWLFKTIPNSDYRNSKASFYDVNLHINHTIDGNNSLYLSGYLSRDRFKLNSDTTYGYGNRNLNIKWKHNFNSKLYGLLTAAFDHYDYSVEGNHTPIDAYKLDFDINQTSLRADFHFNPNNTHAINFGLSTMLYKMRPGSFSPAGAESLVIQKTLDTEQALESALYIGDQVNITPELSVSAGIRYSLFNYLGPHDVYGYAPGIPRDKSSITDTSNFASGKMIKTYQGPEYRVSVRYSLSESSSLKLSYNTLRQYIHMLSNTTAISPTDIWKLSDPNIRPQLGEQISLGFYKNFGTTNVIETSLEIYYKRLRNYLDYKSGAVLLMNEHIETDVFNSSGKAYGAELMIKKPSGQINGWFSYTYSRTLLKMDDPIGGTLINKGKYYPANFDKPHSANLIFNYRISHRYSFSITGVYSTGRPITLPVAIFNFNGSQRVFYSDRNEYRIPDYMRADMSVNIEGNHKKNKLTHNSWSFGVYNLTARHNPYSVYFIQEGGSVKGYKLAVFGTAIPFLTYNFRF